MEKLENIPVKLMPEQIASKLRLDIRREAFEEVRALIGTAQALINARAVYKVCYIEDRFEDAISLDGIRFTSRVLRKNLEKAERVFPYVVTIGPELEDTASSCEDLLEQYYLDVIGNVAVTAARESLENYLRDRFGLGTMSKMSPGSLKDWPIREQKNLFSILEDVQSAIGVRLMRSFLMMPRKSVSGIYFPTEIPFLSCQLCPRKDCPSRQAAYDRNLAQTYRIK